MRTPSHDLHNFPDHNFIPSSLSHWTRVRKIPKLQIVICNLSSPTLPYPIPNERSNDCLFAVGWRISQFVYFILQAVLVWGKIR